MFLFYNEEVSKSMVILNRNRGALFHFAEEGKRTGLEMGKFLLTKSRGRKICPFTCDEENIRTKGLLRLGPFTDLDIKLSDTKAF